MLFQLPRPLLGRSPYRLRFQLGGPEEVAGFLLCLASVPVGIRVDGESRIAGVLECFLAQAFGLGRQLANACRGVLVSLAPYVESLRLRLREGLFRGFLGCLEDLADTVADG